MPPKKNPLGDARKRLQEKIDSIKEQSEYIIQVLNTTVSNAVDPAVELLNQKERKKFFNKYSQVSQNLEKCLDFLLVLSDHVADPRDGSDESGSSDDEGDSSKEEKDEETEKKKNKEDGRCEKQAKVVQSVKTHTAQEEKPSNEERPVRHGSLSDKPGGTYTKTGSENKGASSASKSSDSTQPRKNKKSPQTSKQTQPKDSIQKHENDKHQLNSVNPPEDTRKADAEKTPATSVKSSSISPLQESAIKRFVPSQVKMPQSYREEQRRIENKEDRKSPIQTKPRPQSLGGSQAEVSGTDKRSSPIQTKPVLPRAASLTDVSGTGKKSSVQGQKVDKPSRRGSATKVFYLKPYPFTNGQCVEVVVTEVLSPWELWIQPTDNGFNLLMEKMCMQFAKAAASGYKGGLSSPPSVGEYCCARFTIDDTWYRARVVGLHQSGDPIKQTEGRPQRKNSSSSTSSLDNTYPGLEVEVLCIDDGNRERLPLSRLRPLDDNLAGVPCQALCCALAGVKPLVQNAVKLQGDSVWKEEAIEWLRNKVSGTKLLAYPRKADEDPLIMVDLYFMSSRTKSSKSKGQGNDSVLPGLQHSIGNIMVIEGFAQRVDQDPPPDSKNTSPRSASSEGFLSRSCSSLSVTSLQDCAMPVFEEPAAEEGPVTQSRSVNQDSPVTQTNAVTQRGSAVTYGSAVTQGSKKVQDDSKVERNGTQNVSQSHTIMTDHLEKSHSKTPNQSVTQQQHFTHSKDLKCHAKDLKEKTALPQTTHNQEMEHVSENSTMVKRESPRYSPEGSSLIGSLDEQQVPDLDSVCPEVNKKRLYLPSQDQPLLLEVMMAEAVSPSEFYVHLITPEAVLLAELTADLDEYYKNSDVTSTPADYRLTIGDYCCSQFTADNMWCRAQVIDVKISSSAGRDGQESEALRADIHVFYIDYGNCEWVAMENTRPLLPKFMILPGFAVKCRLVDVKPAVNEDENTATLSNKTPSPREPETTANDVKNAADEDTSQATSNPSSESTKTNTTLTAEVKTDEKDEQSVFKFCASNNKGKVPKRRRGKKYQKIVLDKNVVQRAAGDESGDSELSDGLVFDWPGEGDEKTKDKSEEESALPEKYLLPSPDQEPSEDSKLQTNQEDIQPEWSEEAIELFKGLTGDDKPLRGVMVPWNARVYQKVYYPRDSTPDGSRIDITYKRPTLAIKLYDTTGEEDIDISQILVDTGLAELCEVEQQQVEELVPVKGRREEAKTVQISLVDLENAAEQLEREGTGAISPVGSSCSSLDDDEALQFWNPMMEDYASSTNTYRIDKDDLDIAFHGFKPIENQVCRFFQSTRSRCWRGENCPFLHVKKGEADTSMMVQAFCENSEFTVDLPNPGSWVGVRVTAALNPGHFWVQFPCGSGPIEKRIMEARLGLSVDGQDKEDDEDEHFEAMAERMKKFYSRNLFRDSSSILPAMGELVVAKYSSNDAWYRARVTDVRDGEFQVYFVDYGNTEWTAERNVKRMLPQFLHIPFQAVECFLANVETIEEGGEWSAEASKVFESLTQDKLLIAHVLSIACNNTMCVELYDTQNDEVNINEEMIKQGYAVESTVRIDKPRQIKTVAASDEDSSDCEIIEVPG